MIGHGERWAMLAFLAGLAAFVQPARAAAPVLSSVTESACAPAETISSTFEQQVCYRGASGYETCRWIPRTHTVTIPATCLDGPAAGGGALVRK